MEYELTMPPPDGAGIPQGVAPQSDRLATPSPRGRTPTPLMIPTRPPASDAPLPEPPAEELPADERDFSLSDTTIQLSTIALRARKPERPLPTSMIRNVLLLGYDAILLFIAYLLAYDVRFAALGSVPFGNIPVIRLNVATLSGFAVAYVVVTLVLLYARGFYHLHVSGAPLHRVAIIVTAATLFLAFFSAYQFFFPTANPVQGANTRALIVFAWLGAIVMLIAGRAMLSGIVVLGYRLGIGRTRAIVVGSDRMGKLVMQHVAAATPLGYEVVGFISSSEQVPEDFGRFHTLGTIRDLERAIWEKRVAEVFIALPSSANKLISETIAICKRTGTFFRMIPDLHELSLTRVDIVSIDGVPTLSARRASADGWQRRAKRALDVAGAGTMLLLGSPIWLLLLLIIRLDSPGPAIYSQTRIGLRGKPFTSLKFRSMRVDADQHKADLVAENKAGRGLFKLKNDPRCTRVGRWIRRMSLDEIPQLWNVLRGEMSLVGPRPPLPEEYARYEEWECRRLEVVPGLTGLWQVRGRSDIDFDEMVLMDLFYIENWSLRLDVQIVLKTAGVVIFSRGAY
jgi:exopolysaccharide biosynthesis polyprenyl glycosylphosphotransferase